VHIGGTNRRLRIFLTKQKANWMNKRLALLFHRSDLATKTL
jgi:hypothetical protein